MLFMTILYSLLLALTYFLSWQRIKPKIISVATLRLFCVRLPPSLHRKWNSRNEYSELKAAGTELPMTSVVLSCPILSCPVVELVSINASFAFARIHTHSHSHKQEEQTKKNNPSNAFECH